MTAAERPAVPTFQRELDPLLLQPIRLLAMCLLADMRWSDDLTLARALRVHPRSCAVHTDHLRAAGYVEIRAYCRRTKLRLTPLGLDRLTEHVTALHRVADTAAQLISARRAEVQPPVCDSRSDEPLKPA
ncbi:transcriptional regulator [Amycolatopsis sp. CA-230715]|uniref:transcriptional regulator n=1 Tax=Amycolatopsis sp. CA-230715 TaxID=2745196 RepID=UPI001C0309D4|nr:transcriptional regulator [Amycolatopsis sp. CA-230715]QWF84969.1 hypothetical protein HUW46_08421 [Amycolatopsis sp. CA-230715]